MYLYINNHQHLNQNKNHTASNFPFASWYQWADFCQTVGLMCILNSDTKCFFSHSVFWRLKNLLFSTNTLWTHYLYSPFSSLAWCLQDLQDEVARENEELQRLQAQRQKVQEALEELDQQKGSLEEQLTHIRQQTSQETQLVCLLFMGDFFQYFIFTDMTDREWSLPIVWTDNWFHPHDSNLEW